MPRWKWFIAGLYYRHPLCCVLRFTFHSKENYGKVMGSRYTPKSGVYVPCRIFHFPNTEEDPAPVWLTSIRSAAEGAISEYRFEGAPGEYYEHLNDIMMDRLFGNV